jgi:single-stranded-DNA-specific exonuclease
MEKEWKLKPQPEPSEISVHPELPAMVTQLLAERDIHTNEQIDNFLNPDYSDLHDPFLIKDMRKVVDRIMQAIMGNEKILIYGDYDADGVTGTTILYTTISKLMSIFSQKSDIPLVKAVDLDNDKPSNLLYYIPDRSKEGYGLNDDSVHYILNQEVNLVITIDCGVSNHSQIEFMQKSGIDVLVVDHHSIPNVLPEAFGLIVPKRKEDPYPFKELCGAGLSFKVASALLIDIKFSGLSHRIPSGFEKWLLDFAAIGTIADMVPLFGENRIIVRYGLYVMAKTKNIGLKMLMKEIGIKAEVKEFPDSEHLDSNITVYSVGFQIAPRINAAGRIDHANTAMELFLSSAPEAAQKYAAELNRLNEERKVLTAQVFEEVDQRLQSKGAIIEKTKIIFEGDEHWPAGILGIVAARVAQKYYRPTFIYEIQKRSSVASARSIPGFNLYEAVEYIRPHLRAGGGHAGAAGMSFSNEEAGPIRSKLNEFGDKMLTPEMLHPVLLIDVELQPDEVNWYMYDMIQKLSPFGMGNSEPVFMMKHLLIRRIDLVGKDQSHLKLELQSEGQVGVPLNFQAIGFSMGSKVHEIYENDLVDIVFQMDVNEWGSKRELHIVLKDIRKHKSDS